MFGGVVLDCRKKMTFDLTADDYKIQNHSEVRGAQVGLMAHKSFTVFATGI